jgi:hypothetical protein
MSSGWDAILVAIPSLVLLFAGFFRLDEVIAAPKRRAKAHFMSGELDEDGRQVIFDPDGELWLESELQPKSFLEKL